MLLRYNKQPVNVTLNLPGSKSISNRLLILKEIFGNDTMELQNLSPAQDTQDLVKALYQIRANSTNVIDIGHAGTDMRFLTAFLSTQPGNWILTGSQRMKERPVKQLADALRQLGADITYIEKEGFPPININGKKLTGGLIEIDGSISSQFISALLLISPLFEKGLELTIKNNIVSWPYIQMTIDLLSQFGITVKQHDNCLTTTHSKLKTKNLKLFVEPDWSSASYWYSVAALSKNSIIKLPGLTKNSLQGDSVLPAIYDKLGVISEFDDSQLILKNKSDYVSEFEYNFQDCPDIAQTVAVTCLGLGINCHLTGLSTLKQKETDRLIALKNELEKFGAEVTITSNSLSLRSSKLKTQNVKSQTLDLKLKTYNDHRMAMAFAPLVFIFGQIEIEDPQVVKKSYPQFWDHLSQAGISCI